MTADSKAGVISVPAVELDETPAERRVVIDFDVPARMRDGAVLRADVYRPANQGPWPTIVIRTPYDKTSLTENAWHGLSPSEAARRGFIVVIQDVRGRFKSEGEWEPGRNEARDGADTITWAAALPGSNGRVGAFGGSYCGGNVWQAALERPDALKAIIPFMTWNEPTDGLLSRGGATQLEIAGMWPLERAFDWLSRRDLSPEELRSCLGSLLKEIDGLTSGGYWELPIRHWPVHARHQIPQFVDPGRAADRELTEFLRLADKYDQINLPSLHMGGWFDQFTQATLDNFVAMRGTGHETRLIVGPWTHMDFMDPVGERYFGVLSGREAEGWADECLRFFARHLRGNRSVDDQDFATPVRLFVMGRNEWRDEEEWPLTRAKTERWNLHAEGSLSQDTPAEGAVRSFLVYDPANPVPTHGGVSAAFNASGPVDQQRTEARDDVVIFSSSVLEEDLEVTGRVRAVLHVKSSTPSTDWVVRLCDVTPDGRSFNVCEGIVRIGARADRLQAVEVDLWSTSNVFLAGHRIRVQVANSCFPRWDRNLNTGDQTAPGFVTAYQQLYHDADHPSYIELPVVEN